MIILGIATVIVGIGIIVGGVIGPSGDPPARTPATSPMPAPTENPMLTTTGLAVLHAIPFKNWGIDDAMWGRCTQSDVDAERAVIAHTKEWALTLDDGEVRAAYLGWLNHFEKQLPDIEAELRDHMKRQKWDTDNATVKARLSEIPKPPVVTP